MAARQGRQRNPQAAAGRISVVGGVVVGGWRILALRIRGIADPVVLVQPVAEVDQSAALAAEGTPGRGVGPFHWLSAMGTGNGDRHGYNTQQVSLK